MTTAIVGPGTQLPKLIAHQPSTEISIDLIVAQPWTGFFCEHPQLCLTIIPREQGLRWDVGFTVLYVPVLMS